MKRKADLDLCSSQRLIISYKESGGGSDDKVDL